MSVLLITDGRPETAALARWLSERGPASTIEGRSALDARKIAAARRKGGFVERVVLLSGEDLPGSAPGAGRAVHTIREWLRDLSPLDARASGKGRIELRIAEGAEGSAEVQALLAALSPVKRREPDVAVRRGRGRPPGSNPFRGAGLDVCVCLLIDPDRSWSERQIGEAVSRAPSQVHRALVELGRRGYVSRARGSIRVPEPLVLRDDLLVSWKEHAAPPREARWFSTPAKSLPASVFRASKGRANAILAGAAAATGPAALVGETTSIYLDPEGFTLPEEEFLPVPPGTGELAVWRSPSSSVFLFPRRVRGGQATNRVITWLDLAVAGTERHLEAAEAVWSDRDASS